MKRHILVTIVACCLLAFTGTGWALNVDYFLTSADIKSGDHFVEDWLQDYFSDPTLTFDKMDNNTGWQEINGYWAKSVSDPYPEYFFIKIGDSNTFDSHWLYRNDPELDWLVVDHSIISDGLDRDRISHWAVIGGQKVPEPGTLVLLGIGMLGVAAYRRKMS